MIKILHPPRVISKKKVLFSHLLLIAGIILLDIWLFLSKIANPMLLGGAIWTIGGGICLIFVYILRTEADTN